MIGFDLLARANLTSISAKELTHDHVPCDLCWPNELRIMFTEMSNACHVEIPSLEFVGRQLPIRWELTKYEPYLCPCPCQIGVWISSNSYSACSAPTIHILNHTHNKSNVMSMRNYILPSNQNCLLFISSCPNLNLRI